MKRNPEKILNSLTEHSSDLAYKFERLYRILFNEEMYYIAYERIYAKQGNMTKGVDGKTIDGFSISHVERLIDALKDETYQPKPSQRVYIPKKNGKMRPLGIPSFIDKLLQEVIRMIWKQYTRAVLKTPLMVSDHREVHRLHFGAYKRHSTILNGLSREILKASSITSTMKY